ncbi:MAG: protein DA1 [Azoarcus sp.]|jgi:hypothetical protein|nr:protein DA1 [Azoarcus sp.]
MHCTYCATMIRPAHWPIFMPGRTGLRYGDGRIICAPCHRTAIKHGHQLEAVWQHVRHCFAELGLTIRWDQVFLRLQDRRAMQQVGANTVGYAQVVICRDRIDSRVVMLYGMPAALAVETLAHELGHVWCCEQHVRFSPDSKDEEGFCNVLGCLALQRLGQQHNAPERIRAMFANPDPVYGEKFRQQWQTMQKLGWNDYRQQLLRTPVTGHVMVAHGIKCCANVPGIQVWVI